MDMLGSISLGTAMLSEYRHSDPSEMGMSDNTVLRFPEAFARNCRQGGLRLYQPGMYLYHRMNCEEFKPEASLYSMLITGTSALLDKMMKGQDKRLDTGVTLSIIYTFSMMRSDLSDYDRDIENIINKCFDILSGNFGKRHYLEKRHCHTAAYSKLVSGKFMLQQGFAFQTRHTASHIQYGDGV